MAWTKQNTPSTALVENEDLRGTFYYSDEHASPPNALRWLLLIANDDGSTDSGDVLVSDHVQLIGALGSSLITLRNAALVDAGYVNS